MSEVDNRLAAILLARIREWEDDPDTYQTEGEWAHQVIFELRAELARSVSDD